MFYNIGRITLIIIGIVSDHDYSKLAYPWWYVKLPRFHNSEYRVGFTFAILFSHSVELTFKKKEYPKDATKIRKRKKSKGGKHRRARQKRLSS